MGSGQEWASDQERLERLERLERFEREAQARWREFKAQHQEELDRIPFLTGARAQRVVLLRAEFQAAERVRKALEADQRTDTQKLLDILEAP